MDKYDCHTEVFYGGQTYDPRKPLDDKLRTIALPEGHMIDVYIEENFTLRVKQEKIAAPTETFTETVPEETPDALGKIKREARREVKLEGQIVEAIGKVSKRKYWRGKPKVSDIEKHLGVQITRDQRDEAFEKFKEEKK